MTSSSDETKSVDLSVVIPVFNESENISVLLEKLLPVAGEMHAIL